MRSSPNIRVTKSSDMIWAGHKPTEGMDELRGALLLCRDLNGKATL